MPKFELVKAGDILWEKRRVGMGNTTLTTETIYEVRVIEVDHSAGWAMVSWNGNSPTKWWARNIEKLSRKKPEREPNVFERARMAQSTR